MDDGFDDLLASSRRALEDNPFEDPFAKPRSASPDPWSTGFSHQTDHSPSVLAAEPVPPTPEHDASTPSTPTRAHPFIATEPLDIASANIEEDAAPSPIPPSTSGFREVTAPVSEEAASTPKAEPTLDAVLTRPTTPPPVPASVPGTPSTAAPAPATPSSSGFRAFTQPSEPSSPTSSSGAFSPPPPLSASSSVFSPLDQPVEHTFASLSLGGEAAGGWHSETSSAFVNERQPSSSTTVWHSREPSAEEDDDDRPLQAIVDKSRAAEQSAKLADGDAAPAPSSETKKGAPPVFVITVDDPQKVGDPIRGYTMYTVHTKTTSPLFQAGSFSVLRRYSDFLWLYETLSLNNPGVVVPPVPEKSPFGRFEDTFVQQRRLGLEKCINKMSNHPVLAKDADLKMFLESDSFALDIKHRKAEMAHERGGLMASIGQTIAGPRFHETDEWFDRQKAYLDSLEAQLRGLVKSIDLVSKQRSDLAAATGEFAQTIGDLSASDIGKPLAHSLVGLADVERKAQDIQSDQSRRDVATIMSTADEYTRLISSVRLAFSSRVRTYHIWQSADGEVRRVKQAHEKNRAQGRIAPDRMGYALSQIAEVERRALEAKQEFEQCSRLIKTEVARFEQERVGDFRSSLQAFLDGMIDGQKQLIAAWEGYQQTLLKRVGPKQGAGSAPALDS